MKKTVENIKEYWEEKAVELRGNPKATTPDFWLREIEIKKIKEILGELRDKKEILDIGCGDGFSTIQIAKSFSDSHFLGGDYSKQMIKNAKLFARKMRLQPRGRIDFRLLDVTRLKLDKKFDVIITDRCLINLPTRSLQRRAIQEIAKTLHRGGHYIMVENFIEGHNGMNQLRKKMGLKEIPVRWHNLYLDEKFIKNIALRLFSLVKRENISSLYYLITRVVYSKMCQLEKREPDYDHPIYKIAADLDEELGDCGPVKLLLFKKRNR